MNHTETVALCRVVKALCPAQAMDRFTPDAWAIVLDDIEFEDAQEAVRNLGKLPLEAHQTRYIDPGNIIGEVRRIKDRRRALERSTEKPREIKQVLMGQTPPPGRRMAQIRELIEAAKPRQVTP